MAQGLVGKALQPKDAREHGTHYHGLIKLVAHLPARPTGYITTEGALDVLSCISLIAQVVQRDPEHPLAHEHIGRRTLVRS